MANQNDIDALRGEFPGKDISVSDDGRTVTYESHELGADDDLDSWIDAIHTYQREFENPQ